MPLESPESGPKPARSLRSRGSALAAPARQLQLLASFPGDFEATLAAHGHDGLRPASLEIFQINLGKLCNMTCRHCHVDAGPDRTDAMMAPETVADCLAALDRTRAHTVDITGGAPELHPQFRHLVEQARRRGKHVIDRCNLTILLAPAFRELPQWLAAHAVEVACSLPHYRRSRTDAQRGDGAFDKSIEALRRLNAAGYGQGDPSRRLTLVSNPAGAYLAGNQTAMEAEWKRELLREHGVRFDRLFVLNNMPIARFLEWLEQSGNLESYLHALLQAFNPAAVPGLMCRNTISVSWDGRIYDCDFNQMLDLPNGPSIRDFDPDAFAARRIRTDRHCYGCTAGAGSSCGGATV
ncbi:MAG: radical SAM/Cys-rich domain protein [Planctomycetota bacterium]|nr:MAG: radical SAM/Cys-rich domain protein [Planctomycetota bacterium]